MNKEKLLESVNSLLLDCQMLSIQNQEEAEAANSMVGEEVKLRNLGEKLRKDEKEPWLKKCQEIDASYKPIQSLLLDCQNILKPKVSIWLKAEKARKEEEARIAREEEERKREAAIALLEAEGSGDNNASPIEVDAALQAANEAEKTRRDAEFAARKTSLTGGDSRARSLKEVWSVEVIDAAALVVALANNAEVQAAAIKVANGMVKAMKNDLNLAGVKPVFEETI